jgi:hypothetical protein
VNALIKRLPNGSKVVKYYTSLCDERHKTECLLDMNGLKRHFSKTDGHIDRILTLLKAEGTDRDEGSIRIETMDRYGLISDTDT